MLTDHALVCSVLHTPHSFFGCFVSGVTKVDGKSFWDENIIDQAPAFDFIWTRTFPLGIWGGSSTCCLSACCACLPRGSLAQSCS